ncbi:MAG: hypothetical protein Q9186_007016 [Xanthomendoza sp. 1 TL-2023]
MFNSACISDREEAKTTLRTSKDTRQILAAVSASPRKIWGETQAGRDPTGRVLGILGMGGIGTEVAKRARAFGMQIQYHNRTPVPGSETGDPKYVGLDELLKTSDVLSLHVPLSSTTQHVIAKPQLEMMKDGVVIVNTSRGQVIDEGALVDALGSGKVFSAGLDVFEEEPKIHPGLLNNQNVVLLPHVATTTFETRRNMELLALENLEEALQNNKLVTQVVEQEV